jgi:hypothetical protein
MFGLQLQDGQFKVAYFLGGRVDRAAAPAGQGRGLIEGLVDR